MQQPYLEGFRLSVEQKRFWNLEEQGSNLTSQLVLLVNGCLEIEKLTLSLRSVVAQNEALRLSFEYLPGMKTPVQILNDFEPLELKRLDAKNRPKDLAIESTLQEEREAFNLSKGLASVLISFSENEHALLITIPAISADTRSLINIAQRLSNFYLGIDSETEEIGFIQFAEWQNELLSSEDAAEGKSYWQKMHQQEFGRVFLPLEKKQNTHTAFNFSSESRQIGCYHTMKETVAEINSSVENFLVAAFQLLLARLSEESNFVLAYRTEGRYEEMKDSIGCYAKYLPLFCTIEEESEFWSFLQKVELEIERLLEWQDYFEYTDNKTEISFEFNQIPSLASNNQTSFNIYRLEPFRESFKLRLFATETEDKLLIRLDYDSSKFTSEAIEILLEEFDTLLARLALRPKDNLRKVDFLGEKERKKLLLDFNSTSVDYDCEQLVDILIEEQAKLAPDKIAVVFEDQKLTYRELNEKAEDIAFLLEGLGVRNNLLVGVYAERSPEIVTAILAILKAGGGYVPLNTAYPKDRLSFILEDSGVKIVLTQKKLLADLPESQIQYICLDSNISKRTRDTVIKRGSEDIAYVIYTSGSTGQPKGVMVTHRNLVHSTKARFSYYKEPIINFLLVSPFAFDSSVAGLFWTLCQGATLTIPSEKFQQDMERFILLFTQNSISHMLCLPSLYSAIMEISSPRQLMTLKTIIVAGEACPKRLVERHLELFPEIDLFNEYGPTEATVWSTVYKCSDEDMFQIPIGAPIPNVKVYVLDSDRELLPLGMAGELCIGGKGVAKGYLNRELLTQEKFIPDPFSNQLSDKIYKTGDLVKFRLDGNIDFLGRVDNQVKIRGFRIELEEIEEAIKEHAAVEQTCVVVKEDESSEKSLVAFISPSNQNAFTVGQVITLEKEKVKIRYLPNDLPIIEQNRSETDFLYKTIFEEKDYLKHGIEIRDGDTIFDIGANIGMFTIFANQQAENIKIFAFEPIPAIFEVLRLNSQLYSPNIKPLNLGVSKSIDSTTFTYYPKLSLMSSRYADTKEDFEVVKSFQQQQQAVDRLVEEVIVDRLEAETVNCQMTTISQMMRDNGIERIDLLKIDAEKSELEILEGIEEEDWGKIAQIVIEVEDRSNRLENVKLILTKHGYRVACQQDSLLENTKLYNLYATKKSRERKEAYRTERWYNPDKLVTNIRHLLKDRLPDHMMPSHFVLLDSLPLSANGKVDRRALSAFDISKREEFLTLATTDIEYFLESEWQKVLGIQRIDIDKNFFELGGDSIKAIILVNKIQEKLKERFSVSAFLKAATISSLAEYLNQTYPDACARLSEDSSYNMQSPTIQLVDRTEIELLPLSFAQQRLWFLSQMEPNSPFYNIPIIIKFNGNLNVKALEMSLNKVIERHEALRTVFPETKGYPYQKIAAELSLNFEIEDLRTFSSDQKKDLLENYIHQESCKPFDLSMGPLVRGVIFQTEDQEYILFLAIHHIIADGWSMGILIRESISIYESYVSRQKIELPPLPLQYADYAVWERNWLKGEKLEKQLGYWKKKLDGVATYKGFSTTRPKVESFQGSKYSFRLDKELMQGLRLMSEKKAVTLFMNLLSAFKFLLHSYSKQSDIVVGTDVASRQEKSIELLIGFFVNQLVLRTDLSGNPSYTELLERVRDVTLEAYSHQEVPFDKLVEVLKPEREGNSMPLFQVKMVLQNNPLPPLSIPDLSIELLEFHNNTAKYDLLLNLTETVEGIVGYFEYSTSIFSLPMIELLFNQYEAILKTVIVEPSIRLDKLQEVMTKVSHRQQLEQKQSLKAVGREKLKNIRREGYTKSQTGD